jgi:hypothetical protein
MKQTAGLEALNKRWLLTCAPEPIEILRPHLDACGDESMRWCREHLATLLASALNVTPLPEDASGTAKSVVEALCDLLEQDYDPTEQASFLSIVTFDNEASVGVSRAALGTACWVPDAAVLLAALLVEYKQPAFDSDRRWRHVVASDPRLDELAPWSVRLIDFETHAKCAAPPSAGSTLALFSDALGTTDYVGAMARLLTVYRDDWPELWTRRGWHISRRLRRRVESFVASTHSPCPVADLIDGAFRCFV